MKHLLSLEIPDTLNSCQIRTIDTSEYDPNVPIECPKLYITLPGFNTPSEFTNVTPGFTKNYNACDLGVQTSNCSSQRNPLTDGVYIFRYSVSPNDTVFVEYYHLRITKALNLYRKVLCCIDVHPCDRDTDKKKKIQQAGFVRTLLDAAKAEVENCHHPKKGMEIYEFAMKKLKKLSCGCGCGCNE